jgi:chromosome segregation ATPase
MGLFDFLKKKELDEIKHLKSQLEKYKPISNIDLEVEKKTNEFKELTDKQSTEINKSQVELSELGSKYENSLETYKKLRKEVGLYESKLDLIDFGIYEPIYDFEKSDDYREEQKKAVQLQKDMIAGETAAICETSWNVGGSEAQGRAMTKRNIKLMLRAFNGECNSLITKVKWNNVSQMQERISKSFDAINKLGKSSTISIQEEYLELKIKELLLEHEFQLKKQKEKEELREIQAQIREEEQAKREFEKAQKDAEKEEKNYQSALEKARKEITELTGEKHDKLQEKIEKLELELKESQERKERAMSMAQQTKRGHVYVISNIGSFGENVYKIGMTRRLEPTDRVKELGDASVPFTFDIHAMIYSNEAPTLEKELHRAFEDRKVNMLNYRKEFFNVSLDEIEKQIKDTGIEAEFIRLPEAMEYRETLAILKKLNSTETEKTIEQEIEDEFPSSLN